MSPSCHNQLFSSFSFLQTITRVIITKNSYKLLLQKSFETMLSNYYQRNHSKQFLKTIIREIIWDSCILQLMMTLFITRGIIPNNSYKLLSQKSFQTMLSNYLKWFLVSIIREIIRNNSYKLLSQKSFKTILTKYYQRNHSKNCLFTMTYITNDA